MNKPFTIQVDIYIDYMFAFHIRYIYVKNLPHTLIFGALALVQAGIIRFNARYVLDKTIFDPGCFDF